MLEIIDKEKISEIVNRIENEKEVSFITKDDKSTYEFENKMPEKIGKNLVDTNSFDNDVKDISNIAQELLKGI